MPIYATPTLLARWITGDPEATAEQGPANAGVLLRSASSTVRKATRRKVYDTDEYDLPTKPAYLLAMQEATCAVAATLAELKINPNAGGAGLGAVVQSKGLGSASVTYANSADREALRTQLAQGGITQEAYDILLNAGMITNDIDTSQSARGVWAAGPWPVS